MFVRAPVKPGPQFKDIPRDRVTHAMFDRIFVLLNAYSAFQNSVNHDFFQRYASSCLLVLIHVPTLVSLITIRFGINIGGRHFLKINNRRVWNNHRRDNIIKIFLYKLSLVGQLFIQCPKLIIVGYPIRA